MKWYALRTNKFGFEEKAFEPDGFVSTLHECAVFAFNGR